MPTNWVDDRQSTVAHNHFKEDYIPKPKYIIHVGIGDKTLYMHKPRCIYISESRTYIVHGTNHNECMKML